MKNKNFKKDAEKPAIDTESLKNQLARVLADYDNLKKRIDAEKADFIKLANSRFSLKLFPLLDSLREAQKHLHDSGIAIIISSFESVLTEEGFNEIIAKAGEDFNEKIHEAVETVETDKKENNNKIAEVSLSGWRMGDFILRFAKVSVYKMKKGKNE